MKEEILGRRYAKAVFGLAVEESRVDAYRKALRAFQKALKVHPDLLKLLAMREIALEKKKSIMEWFAKRFSFPVPLADFFSLLLDRGRIALFPAIFKSFEELANQKNNVVMAKIYAADLDITKKSLDELKQVLGQLTKKTVECEWQPDPTLLAGFKVQIGDTIYDGSVKEKLAQLRRHCGN